jgi:phospholipid-binding lipoprotein MlaA
MRRCFFLLVFLVLVSVPGDLRAGTGGAAAPGGFLPGEDGAWASGPAVPGGIVPGEAFKGEVTDGEPAEENAEPPAAEDLFADEEPFEDPFAEEEFPTIADPLEPVNRAFFTFNDRLYFWVLRPVARGYSRVVPQRARVSVRNAFSNIATPIRFANSLLQGKFEGAGVEILRLVINSTIGVAGLFDPARSRFGLRKSEEDLGQTLGRYGLGHGFYLVIPVLGPSSLRDFGGYAGDLFLDPVNYVRPWEAALGIRTVNVVNGTSLILGEYEDLKAAALDPYLAVRDGYVQFRKKRVEE